MWTRLEYRTQCTICFAQERAKSGEVYEVEPEHLLYAILTDKECCGYLALVKTGLNMLKLEDAINMELKRMDRKTDNTSEFDSEKISLSISSKKVIDYAFSLTMPRGFKFKMSKISTGHLLSGIIFVNQGTLGRGYLQELDFHRDKLETILKTLEYKETPTSVTTVRDKQFSLLSLRG